MARPLKVWYHTKRQAWVIEPNGKIHVLVKGPKDRTTEKLAQDECKLYIAKQVELQRANPPVDAGDPTIASVIEAFLQHDEKHSSTRTYYERKRYLQLFAEKHGRKMVRECKPFHLSSWLDDHSEWSNAWTHSYIVRCIKRPFNWAVDEELIPRNPFRGVKHRTGDPRREMTPDEYTQLVKAAAKNQRLVEVLKFMYITGCRPGEVWQLRWSDIDWDRQIIKLIKHKTAKRQKTPKPRIISLAVPEAREILQKIQERDDHPEFVFVSRLKKPWARNGVQQNVKRLREKIGLPSGVVVYGLRHHWVTRGLEQGVPLKNVSEGAGHTSTRVTEAHYAHLDGKEDMLHETMRRVNGLDPDV